MSEQQQQQQYEAEEQSTGKKLICLFGLSADPPTGYGGHVGIAQTLQQQERWDEVWVMPVYRHTFQEKRGRMVSFEHRLKMCQLAFAHLNEVDREKSSQQQNKQTKIVVSDMEYMSWKNAVNDIPDESEREKVSVGTAVLLDYLMSAYPNYTFYFCLGADSFVDLVNGKWQQTDRILNELLFDRQTRIYKSPRRIVVLYRAQPKMSSDHDNNNTTTEMATTTVNTDAAPLSLPHSFDYIESLVQGYRAQLLCMDRAEDNVSSTLVRNCLDVTKLRDNPAIILPEVLQYIEEHKLYKFCT